MPQNAFLTPDPATTLSTETRRSAAPSRLATQRWHISLATTAPPPPLVFLHGNPTSSFLWRNVVPHVKRHGPDHCAQLHRPWTLEPSPNDEYHFKDNIAYFDAFFEAFDLTSNVTLVIHDLGGGAAVEFYRATRLPEQIKGNGYMEAMVWPLNWTDIPANWVENFKHFRKREGAKATTEYNFFTGVTLFEHGILRNLSEVEKTVYPEPVTRSGETSPLRIIMPNDIPFDCEPAENAALVKIYSD
jgi:haloalkane dehalogenase